MTVYVRKNESIESAIDRFNRIVDKSGILGEYRAKTAYKSKKQDHRERENERNRKRVKRQK